MALNENWIVGFVDGEGCFSYSLIKNDSMTRGYQIQGEFTVVQHKRDIQLLYKLKTHFKCGTVAKNHGNRFHYRVKNLDQLLTIIIPFFEENKLETNKKLQLPVFKQISQHLKAKTHLTETGFVEVSKLVAKLSALKKM